MGVDRLELDEGYLVIHRRFDNAWITLYGDNAGNHLDKTEALRLGRILIRWAETGELKDA